MAFKSSGAFWEIVHFKAKLVDCTESNGHILKRGVNKQKKKKKNPLFVGKGNIAVNRVGEEENT